MKAASVTVDPHGKCAELALPLVPPRVADRVIYLDPGNLEHIPCANPFHKTEGGHAQVFKLAHDDVEMIRMLYSKSSWGPNIEDTLLMLFALGHSVGGEFNYAHLYQILMRDRRGEKLLAEAFPALQSNPFLSDWWDNQFFKQHLDDLKRARNKLNHFVAQEPQCYISAQCADRYSIRSISRNGGHLIANLCIGAISQSEATRMCRMLIRRVFMVVAERLREPNTDWPTLDLFVDEAQYGSSSHFGFGDILREGRKCRLRVTVGVQSRSNVSDADRLALSEVGTVVAFGASYEESRRLFKEFREQVPEREFRHRRVADAYALLGDEAVSFQSLPLGKANLEIAEAIRSRSRREHCIPIAEAREIMRELWDGNRPPVKGFDRWS